MKGLRGFVAGRRAIEFGSNARQQASGFKDLALLGGVDPTFHWRVNDASVLSGDYQCQDAAWYRRPFQVWNGEDLGAVNIECLARGASRELQRQHTHANEICAMDPFEAFANDHAHAQQANTLRSPVS